MLLLRYTFTYFMFGLLSVFYLRFRQKKISNFFYNLRKTIKSIFVTLYQHFMIL